MTLVTFQEENIQVSHGQHQRLRRGMAAFLVRKHIVGNEKQAAYLLLTVASIAMATSIYFFLPIIKDAINTANQSDPKAKPHPSSQNINVTG